MIRKLKSLIGQRSPIRLGWHFTKAFLAALKYGFPARKLKVIGISGTDGKTTTVGMVAHILLGAGKKVGAASTAYVQVNEEFRENETHLTSINPFELQKILRELVSKGCEYAVIEMSSHGLVQGRTAFTWPCIAGLTNTALEHLDYHGSMERYRADKGKMFEMLNPPIQRTLAACGMGGIRGTKVLNGTDESFAMYSKIPSDKTIVFNGEGNSMWLTDVQATNESASATLHAANGAHRLRLSIPGTFNLENAMCAIGCTTNLGIPLESALQSLTTFKSLPGRLERIDEGQPFSVFVDFAVSPQSYERTLETLRKIVGDSGRVLVLCCSCGNRMEEKRVVVGQVCSKLADIVVATEDETYGEDPHKVLDEVWAGIDQTQTDAHKIFDRREAITFLFNNAEPGDAVALCGMGPFSTFTRLEGRVEWDEREVARELLREL